MEDPPQLWAGQLRPREKTPEAHRTAFLKAIDADPDDESALFRSLECC